MSMRCVDLFCGGGGLSLGFQNAGFKIIEAFDNWKPALDVYKLNFSHDASELDLSNIEAALSTISRLKPDIIIGGPPCQDFSSAGKRDENGGRADLTYKYADIICGIKPKWFVMENVERIKKSRILSECIEKFKQAGYGLTSAIMDASYCGVPQARTRFFLIGCLGAAHNALLPSLEENLSDKPMSIRDYLGDELGIDYYYRHPRNYSRRGVFSIDEPSPTIRGVNRPIPSGYKLNSCDPVDVDINKIRPLTTLERSYIQTFPKNFVFTGTKTTVEQIIGNAVPIKLAEYIARCILGYSKERQLSKGISQPFMLAQKAMRK